MIIHWLGHASFRIITDNKIIYIDPYYGEDYQVKADIILLTHDHYDHFSQEKVSKIRKDETIILAPESVSNILDGVITLKPGEETDVENIKFMAVDSYNLNIPNHGKGQGNGYLITSENKVLYNAGDTDLVPEIQHLNADICLVPVGGTYTMDAKQAAELIKMLRPKLAIPMHWGSGIVGHRDDAEYFKELLEETETKVVILEIGEDIEI